ncbi:hypothetical protein EOD41_02240 [Mucilaginibacter limnophilus]|uniref:HEAT repeat domain-containing protein n=1 Tax=Mucilaginibacter limnophilus TaxID=1932778 RepID=A0A437MYT0_9SPHI|nr:hypothetical protein [Mucilaginibacter limnophilus]RVU02779.1 hypothetical protein EOD41_02240 [Mucilaginibacter limnophilus]
MLNKQELLKQIEHTIGKPRVLELTALMRKHHFPLTDLIDLTFHEDKNVSFRASWLLENILLKNTAEYIDYLSYLIKRFPDANNPSSQRHYANIMIRLTSPKANKAIKEKLNGVDMEPVIEKLFDWLIDPKVLVAVKCSAGEALMHLSKRYDWIAEELANQMEFLMKNGTAAIQARGKMILGKLEPPAP